MIRQRSDSPKHASANELAFAASALGSRIACFRYVSYFV